LQVALAQPPIYVRSGVNTLKGSAYDPSGVSSVTVQILDQAGDTTDTTCLVARPHSGKWSCTVEMSESKNDLRYFARLKATNPFGYPSEWSAWRVLVIDALPPTVKLDIASQAALSMVIGPVRTRLTGQIQDNDLVKSVEMCQQRAGATHMASCRPVDLTANHVVSGTWTTTLLVPLGVDYASQTLSLYGWDAAGNRSSLPLEYTFWFDTLAPKVTVTTRLPSITLPAYSINPQPILAGTASDGSGQVEIVVRLTSAETGTRRSVVPVQNNQWSYVPGINTTGVYSLSLQALDTAGNLTSLDSWTLEVADSFQLWLPIINHD
jgi:hypothetical protein